MSRLPIASRDDLLAELDLIEVERERHLLATVTHQEHWQNRLDTLDDQARDLRRQLEAMDEAA